MEWFKEAEPAYLDKLFEKIIKARSHNIIEAIKKLKDRTGSLGGYHSLSIGNNLAAAVTSSATIHASPSSSRITHKRNSLVPASPNPESEGSRKYISRLTENLFSSSNK